MKNNEFKLLWPFYVTALIASSFSVALPVWVIFFQKQFSFIQISFAISLQSLAAILCEIPTGAIADSFGRKVSVVLGIILQGVLWLALPFIELDLLLYLAFFLMGVLRTMESGADKAWVIDWLKDNHRENLIQDMFIKIQSLKSIGCVVSSLLATLLLFYFQIKFLFIVQGCGYIIESCLLCIFAREIVHRRVHRKKIKIKKLFQDAVRTSKKGVNFLLKSKPLLYLVLATTFAVSSKDFGCIAWQPYLVNLTLPAEYLGIVFSIGSIIGIVTPFLTKKLLQKLGQEKHYLSATTLVEFTCLASLYFINTPFFSLGIIVYLLVIIISDLQSPVGSLLFQSLIPNNIRATLGSLQSMVFAVFSFFITTIGGYTMDKQGPKMAILCFSLFLIPATFLYLNIGKPDRPLAKRHR